MHGTAANLFSPPQPPVPTFYDPFATLSRMAERKPFVEYLLEAERVKKAPNEAIINACEAFLRAYERERAQIISATASRLRRHAEEA